MEKELIKIVKDVFLFFLMKVHYKEEVGENRVLKAKIIIFPPPE
jgi:hypothetical protein